MAYPSFPVFENAGSLDYSTGYAVYLSSYTRYEYNSDEKRLENWKKHQVWFDLAAEVFLDDYAVDVLDQEHSDSELRRQVIGATFDRANTFFVVYVERETWDGFDVIRIISARNANKKERKTYEAGLLR